MKVMGNASSIIEDWNETISNQITTSSTPTWNSMSTMLVSVSKRVTTIEPIRSTCVKPDLSEPEFHRYACEGSKVASWIASVFLLSMIIFGVIKCLTSHGMRNIFDLRLNGISFPKRPEFFVLLCSTLPLVFTLITRPLFDPLSETHDRFIRGWGLAQTRYFFDLFTRTATNYHLVYWAYRTPLINFFWLIKHDIGKLWTDWKNRPKPEKKSVEKTKRLALTLRSKTNSSQPPPTVKRAGRTKEHGVIKKRDRSKSIRSNRSNSKAPSQASNEQTPSAQVQVNHTGGVNLITPQRLFTDQNDLMNPYGMMMGGKMNEQMQAFGQANPFMYSNPYSAYGQMMQYSMNQPGGYMHPMSMMNQPGGLSIHQHPNMGSHADMKNLHMLNDGEKQGSVLARKFFKTVRLNVERPPPSREFTIRCKRIIPGCIYFISLFVTLPSLFAFELEPTEMRFKAVRCTPSCQSFFYYDMVALVALPTMFIIAGFYHAVLARKQLNGGLKSTYRLRCYYVTFILLNIPMFVLMLTSIGLRFRGRIDHDIYGTLVIVTTTAYHANFALKSTVYTTGCNCICCSEDCLNRVPIMHRLMEFFTTPVSLKDKRHAFEGTIIKVTTESEA